MNKTIPSSEKILFIISLVFLINQNFLFSQWVQIEPYSIPNVYAVAVTDSSIISGCGSGIWLTTNGGQNWFLRVSEFTYSLAKNNSTVLAGVIDFIPYNGVYRTTNYGLSWTQTQLNNRDVYSFLYSGTNVLAGTWSYGIYLSTDDGISWTQTALNTKNVLCFTRNLSRIFAGTYFFGVYSSSDNGQTWLQTSLNTQHVRALTTIGQQVFAGTETFGVYCTSNNGANWTQTSLNNVLVYSLVSVGHLLFAGTDTGGVYETTDIGLTWVQRNEGIGRIRINSLYTTSEYIYAGTQGASLWRRPLSEFTGIKKTGNLIPETYSLSQNYPNPFNPSTTIDYQLPISGHVKISVFDVLGQEVKTLVNEYKQARTYEVRFDASELPSGVYFYKITSGDFTSTKKLTLIK